jgi:phospholipid N-methyltransferase
LTDLIHSLKKLEAYIISEEYKGYDPYDSLMSPLFKFPLLRSNKIIRFGFQQVYRRIPFNTRKLFGIKKGLNPVTLGLCIQAYTYLSQILPAEKNFYLKEIDSLLDKLILLKSKGFSGACWGYDFDWEARYTKIPAHKPTIVATGIITNALYSNYKITGNQHSLSLILDSVNFLKDLNKTYDGNDFCFSYSPFDKQIVFNATMKGARLLAQVYSITKENSLEEEAKKIVAFVMKYQNKDGSWPYSHGDDRKWTDNFHTGYIIDALLEYCNLIENDDYRKNLEKALNYYENNFICDNGIPKYYKDSIFPIDSTAAAQTIITLVKFGCMESAQKVVEWIVLNMQNIKGYFYFQRKKFYTNKISYMRWSNAWMLSALSYFILKSERL